MKTLLTILFAAFALSTIPTHVFAQDPLPVVNGAGDGTLAVPGPEPDPWWKQVENMQGLLLKWITAIGIVLTAFMGMVFGILMMFKSKMTELKNRQDRQNDEKQNLTNQVIDMAKSMPPKDRIS